MPQKCRTPRLVAVESVKSAFPAIDNYVNCLEKI